MIILELNENGKQMVQHHIHYKEVDGYDEIVMMEKGEHRALHHRLREGGKCNIPVNELQKISTAAHRRTKKYVDNKKQYDKSNICQIDFNETMMSNVSFQEYVRYNFNTGNISYSSRFRGMNGIKLPVVEVM